MEQDFKHWSTENGLSTTNGAVFWMNPKEGPSVSSTTQNTTCQQQLLFCFSLRSLPSLALLTFTQRTPLSASNAVYFCVYIVDLRSGCRLVLQTADCDGLKGKSNSAGDVVIAQLTVPTGKPYEVTDPVLYVSCSRKRDDLYLQTHTLWGSA